MRRIAATNSVLLGVLALAGSTALAEIPETFTNLKVLPRDIGKPQLVATMRGISDALGVSCTFCHVEKVPGDRDSIDWASDDLDPKRIARGMLTMVGGINRDLLPIATREAKEPVGVVSCVTCHRGLTDPATLDQVLLETADEKGVDAAVAQYRDLRARYYGTGSYDFSPAPLATVAETLARNKGDHAGAAKLVDLNVEMHPDDAEVYVMRAQLQWTAGNKAGARESAQKALTLDPQNRQAAHLLEQLEDGK